MSRKPLRRPCVAEHAAEPAAARHAQHRLPAGRAGSSLGLRTGQEHGARPCGSSGACRGCASIGRLRSGVDSRANSQQSSRALSSGLSDAVAPISIPLINPGPDSPPHRDATPSPPLSGWRGIIRYPWQPLELIPQRGRVPGAAGPGSFTSRIRLRSGQWSRNSGCGAAREPRARALGHGCYRSLDNRLLCVYSTFEQPVQPIRSVRSVTHAL